MLLKSMMSPRAATACMSVAFLGLMAGLSHAEDLDLTDPSGVEVTGEETADPDLIFVVDPIAFEGGEPINTDGIGDGEPLPDVVNDGEMGEEPDVTITEFPESTCGGCEYENVAGGPEVQRDILLSGSATSSRLDQDAASVSVRNESNICYSAELYVPLLCDWQRPFVGDLMP